MEMRRKWKGKPKIHPQHRAHRSSMPISCRGPIHLMAFRKSPKVQSVPNILRFQRSKWRHRMEARSLRRRPPMNQPCNLLWNEQSRMCLRQEVISTQDRMQHLRRQGTQAEASPDRVPNQVTTNHHKPFGNKCRHVLLMTPLHNPSEFCTSKHWQNLTLNMQDDSNRLPLNLTRYAHRIVGNWTRRRPPPSWS